MGWSGNFVASLNGATKLILRPRVSTLGQRASLIHAAMSFTQVDARAVRHLNQFPTFSFPTADERIAHQSLNRYRFSWHAGESITPVAIRLVNQTCLAQSGK
jgi:hypothetical protein